MKHPFALIVVDNSAKFLLCWNNTFHYILNYQAGIMSVSPSPAYFSISETNPDSLAVFPFFIGLVNSVVKSLLIKQCTSDYICLR